MLYINPHRQNSVGPSVFFKIAKGSREQKVRLSLLDQPSPQCRHPVPGDTSKAIPGEKMRTKKGEMK